MISSFLKLSSSELSAIESYSAFTWGSSGLGAGGGFLARALAGGFLLQKIYKCPCIRYSILGIMLYTCGNFTAAWYFNSLFTLPFFTLMDKKSSQLQVLLAL